MGSKLGNDRKMWYNQWIVEARVKNTGTKILEEVIWKDRGWLESEMLEIEIVEGVKLFVMTNLEYNFGDECHIQVKDWILKGEEDARIIYADI